MWADFFIKGEKKMELTGKLKEQVEKSKNLEDAKKIIEKAGMKLNDEELDKVAGGRIPSSFNLDLPNTFTVPWFFFNKKLSFRIC